MAKVRRFKVGELAGRKAGDRLSLPLAEAQHARVLRLKPGDFVECHDGAGRGAWARLEGESVVLLEDPLEGDRAEARHIVLATAWPKGKRAAVLVEKCTELGVAEIVPLRCARSVVVKDSESEGVARLRRVAAEAAKQSGRTLVPEIGAERAFAQVLAEEGARMQTVLLDPSGTVKLHDWLAQQEGGAAVLLLVGPEGGFSDEELDLAGKAGVARAKMAPYTLRVETACIAAVAAAAAGA